MLDGDKKIFMTITLNFYIVVNKNIYTIIVKKLKYDCNELENKKQLDKIYRNNT